MLIFSYLCKKFKINLNKICDVKNNFYLCHVVSKMMHKVVFGKTKYS